MYSRFYERAAVSRLLIRSRSGTVAAPRAATVLGWCETLCSPIKVRSCSWTWNVANCPEFSGGGPVCWLSGYQPYLMVWLSGCVKSCKALQDASFFNDLLRLAIGVP